MGRIVRELRSLPGAMLAIIILLIVTFYVLNLIQTRAPAPLNNAAGWTFGHATGQSYAAPAAPAMSVVSPYSANANVGPYI
jgi:hypothetical protein